MRPYVSVVVSDAIEDEDKETFELDEDVDLALCTTHQQMHSCSTQRDKLEIIVVIVVILALVLALVCCLVCVGPKNHLARAQLLTEMMALLLPHILAVWRGGPV
jgi:hypothetical protein